nr:uncharacterized protein LOC117227703 isoform X2 [Megalopta genalis]
MDAGSSSIDLTPLRTKRMYRQKFRDEWLQKAEFVLWLEKCEDVYKARCKLCDKTLRVGLTHLKKHRAGGAHQINEEALRIFATEEMGKAASPSDNNTVRVKKAELRFCMDIVEHNRSFNFYNHFVGMLKGAISDSLILKSLSLKRCKANALVQNVINKEVASINIEILKNKYFSIIVDESTDISDTKNLCILVRYVNNGAIRIDLLEYLRIKDGTTENLFKCLQYVLEKNSLNINNVVGICMDNTSVIIGKHESLVSRVLAINKEVAVFPCTCHSVHLIAYDATEHIPKYIIDFLHKIYYYFAQSLMGQTLLEEPQQVLNVTKRKIIEPCPTRWLHLSQSTTVILEQWDTLFRLFAESTICGLENGREIFIPLKSTFTKVYLQFLDYILKKFAKFNLLFQGSNILIHCILPESYRFLRFLGDTFIKPNCMRTDNILFIDIDDEDNLLPLQAIDISEKAKATISEIENKKEATSEEIVQFYSNVQTFYKTAYKGAITRLPFNEQFLNDLQFLDPKIALYIEHHNSQIHSIVGKFESKFDKDTIDIEWRELPSHFSPSEKDNLIKMKIPEFWHTLGNIKDFTDEYKFHNLANLAELCLALPHSNADVEKCLSFITNVKTKDRNRLKSQAVSALARIQLHLKAQNENCITWEVSQRAINLFNSDIYKTEKIPEQLVNIILPNAEDTETSKCLI